MASNPTIKISCDVRDAFPLEKIEEFQGDLKSLSEDSFKRLRHEILESGFAFPLHVWRSPEGTVFCIGGHQRLRVLNQLKDEGYDVPPVPSVIVFADSIKQAKRRVLQDASQYGRVERQGLYEFMSKNEFGPADLASFDLPNLDMAAFNSEFFLDDVTGAEPENVSAEESAGFSHKCSRCGFEED